MDLLSAKFGFLYVSSGFSNGRREELLTRWPWPIKIFLLAAYNKKSGCKLTVFTSLSLLTSNISVLLTSTRFPPEQARTTNYPVPPRNHLSKSYCDTQNDTLMAKCVPRTKTQRPPRNNVTTQLHKGLPPFPGQPPTPQHPIVSPFVPIITWKLSSAGAESSSPTHRDAHALLHQRSSPAPIFKANNLLILSKGRTFRSVLRHVRVVKISYLVKRGHSTTTCWISIQPARKERFHRPHVLSFIQLWVRKKERCLNSLAEYIYHE